MAAGDIKLEIGVDDLEFLAAMHEASKSLEKFGDNADTATRKLAGLDTLQAVMGPRWVKTQTDFINRMGLWQRAQREAGVESAALRAEMKKIGYTFDQYGRRVKIAADRTKASNRGWASMLTNWKVLVPAGIALAGTLGMLVASGFNPLIAAGGVATSIVAGLATPFTTLGAVAVGILGPLSALATLFGVIGGGIAFGSYTAALDPAFAHFKPFDKLRDSLSQLGGMFDHLGMVLGERFVPYLMGAVGWIEKFVLYGDKLAHMSLANAIQSISTTGMTMLEHLNRRIYDIIGRPLYEIFDASFGHAGNRISDAFSSMLGVWTPLVEKMWGVFAHWFDEQHFRRIGERWAGVFASTILPAMLKPVGHILLKIIEGQPWMAAGVAIGALLVPGIGAAFRGVLFGKGAVSIRGVLFGKGAVSIRGLVGRLGGGAAAGGAAGGVGVGEAAGGAGLGISAGMATGIGAVAVGLGALVYWLSTMPGPATKASEAMKRLMSSMRGAPILLSLARTQARSLADAQQHLAKEIAKGTLSIENRMAATRRLTQLEDKHTQTLDHYQKEITLVNGGVEALTNTALGGAIPALGRFGGGLDVVSQKTTEYQSRLKTAITGYSELAQVAKEKGDPALAASARQAAALAHIALQLSQAIKGIPAFKRIVLDFVGQNVNLLTHYGSGQGRNAGASGAIVTRPTYSLIGEAGPEAVIPLSQMPGASPLPGGGVGGVTVNVHVHGSLLHENNLTDAVMSAVQRGFRQGKHLQLASGARLR